MLLLQPHGYAELAPTHAPSHPEAEIRDKWPRESIFDGENVGSVPKKPFNNRADGPKIPNSNFWAQVARDS